jgi:hypothetical protein
MSGEPIRLRRHTDGRVALSFDGDEWVITSIPGYSIYPVLREDDKDCSGPGWSELLVAELPEPDGHERDQASTPWWTPERFAFILRTYPGEVVVTHIDGSGMFSATAHYKTEAQLAELRADALKMLAAVTACERFRQEVDGNSR